MEYYNVDDDYRVKYPTPKYRFFTFPLSLLDDLEVTIRTCIAIACLGVICLYEEEQTVLDEYPLCFLMLVVAVALSLVPFAGAVFSHGVSFMWGAFLGLLGVLLVVEILGAKIEDTIVPFPATQTCIASPVVAPASQVPVTIPIPPFNATTIFIDLEGNLSDPSPYWLSVLIFVGTSFFVFVGESQFFILGSTIVYNFYLATWYTATQTALQPIPDTEDFFLYTRSILIGVAVTIASFLLPLPRLIPTFIPQPRFGCSLIFSQLGSISKKLSDNFVDITTLFLHLHNPSEDKRKVQALTNARFLLLYGILDNCAEILRKLLKVLKLAAQYEPMWLPLPLPRLTTVNRVKDTIREYQTLLFYQDAMLRSLRTYANHASSGVVELPQKLQELVKEFADDVSKLGNFHYQGNPFFCCYDKMSLNIDWDSYSSRFKEITNDFKQHGVAEDEIDKAARLFSLGFHTYFFWCMHGVSVSADKLDKLRHIHETRVLGLLLVLIDWPLHIFGWVLEYLMGVIKLFKEIFLVLNYRIFRVFRP